MSPTAKGTTEQVTLDSLLTNDYTTLCEAINNNPFIDEFTITDRNGDIIVIC